MEITLPIIKYRGIHVRQKEILYQWTNGSDPLTPKDLEVINPSNEEVFAVISLRRYC